MTTLPGQFQTRLHALDNLRATLMWLGIVLHASINVTVQRLCSGLDRIAGEGAL